MLWRSALGVLVGFTASSFSQYRDDAAPLSTVHAVSPPTLDIIMDPANDLVPVRAVIVGGGYTGSRLAYQLDSMFDVTFIDNKNFFELSNDIIPIIANPWEEGKNDEACRRMMVLHRYYLKRSNVLTGCVDGVDDHHVYLKDKRQVPYDLLFVTTGEKKPFPFATKQKTISGRSQELRHFNEFLQTCRKIAVVGGGPVGTSLVEDLAAARPDLEVHLFQSRSELIPTLPGLCRRYALDKLRQHPNVHVHLGARVTELEGFDAAGARVPGPSSAAAVPSTPPSWWRAALPSWAGGAAADAEEAAIARSREPARYTVRYDEVDYAAQKPQSIVSQIYFGKRSSSVDDGAVRGSGAVDGFDYVFPLMGDTPRPIVAGKGKPNILLEHQVADGHYRVSTLMQMLHRPNIFAAGRCTNFPVPRSYGCSDIQARTLFRELSSIVSNPTTVGLHSRDGLQLYRMKVPRVHVRLGVGDGVGCTAWSGGMTGAAAVHEFMQDRNYLVKEFQKPIFYKQQDQSKIKERVTQWLAEEITDVTDFSHC